MHSDPATAQQSPSPPSVWDETLLVSQSLKGKSWRWVEPDTRMAQTLQQRYSLSPLVAAILSARGIGTDKVEQFLQPRLRDCLPDPFHLKDMDKAVARIIQAITAREKIVIFGDYDVDGITSTSLMWRYLNHLGLDATRYLPDRQLEGYGPNADAVDKLKQAGHTLMICLDCGITAFAPLAHAKAVGLDTVVIDHHQGEAELPEAVAVVNPNRLDEDSSCKHLAAVGVTFLTLVALNSKLKATLAADALPPLLEWLDLVALGTICDVMPLRDINRAFVVQGLKIMASRRQIGLRALMDQARIDETPTAYHAGFVLGPRLNAAGRMASGQLGADLLCTHDALLAQSLAMQLEENNRHRQEMEKTQLQDALERVAATLDDHDPIICLSSPDYHVGLIGLLASRLKEQFQRPAVVIALDEKEPGKITGKASARSMTGIDMGQLVLRGRHEGLIESGGGHPMAAGFKVDAAKLPQLHQFLKDAIRTQLKGVPLTETVTVDGLITCNAATVQLAEELERLEPYGQGHPTPKLVIKNLRVQKCDILKEKHLRVFCIDDGGQRINMMAFNVMTNALGQALQDAAQQHRTMHILGTLRLNSWQGRTSAQFTIEDAAFA